MTRIYSYINSINLLSSISLGVLWINKLAGLDLLSNVIINNYVALTAVYAPPVLFVLHLIIISVLCIRHVHVEYFRKASALFSFVNLVVYLLFLLYVKYF